jgi:hypothetical protein
MTHVHTFIDADGVQRAHVDADLCDDCRVKREARPMGPYGPVTQRLYDQEDANGTLKAGDEGWWRVWGSCARDIRPGDLVMAGWKDKDHANNGVIHHAEYEVVEMALFDAPTMNSIRVGFITTTGKFASVGMMQPMELLRWGTGAILGDHVR